MVWVRDWPRTVPSPGTLYGLRLLPPLMILSRQLLTALRLSMAFMKAPLTMGLTGLALVRTIVRWGVSVNPKV